MNVYKVTITEVLSKEIYIDADDETDAVRRVQQLYDEEEIVLGADDFSHMNIDVDHQEA